MENLVKLEKCNYNLGKGKATKNIEKQKFLQVYFTSMYFVVAKLMKTTMIGETVENSTFSKDLLHLSVFIKNISGGRVICINPRGGELPLAFRNIRNDLQFDTFVSDDEWVESAKIFSENVYFGHSHKPLSSLPDMIYDAVLVCEDLAYVDDCDAMLCEYYRLLKPSGLLIGGLYNMSYAENIDALIDTDKRADRNEDLYGSSAISIDCLTTRLDELGFESIEIYSVYGNKRDVSEYVNVSKKNEAPVESWMFKMKTCLISVLK